LGACHVRVDKSLAWSNVVMLHDRLEWLFHCCRRDAHDDARGELQVLSTDPGQQISSSALWKADSFDITFAPRAGLGATSAEMISMPITPRMKELRQQLQLPVLQKYPSLPGVAEDIPEEARQKRLLEMYQEFVLELHAGTYLKQLTSARDCADIHCQLMEDLQTLKLDQCSGRIIEFPLCSVSKVYRIVRDENKWYRNHIDDPYAPVEHIVVVEFMRRKLAFMFSEASKALRFLTCMELLIRHAQQEEAARAQRRMKAATSTIPFRPCGSFDQPDVHIGCSKYVAGACQQGELKCAPVFVHM
jgi:hypothetical protein